jgi:hypothetical protein
MHTKLVLNFSFCVIYGKIELSEHLEDILN